MTTAQDGGRLSALCNGRLYPEEIFLVLISVRGWVNTSAINAAGRIMSMKISNDIIGNRTRGLPTCSAVPQPTAPPRTPFIRWHCIKTDLKKRGVRMWNSFIISRQGQMGREGGGAVTMNTVTSFLVPSTTMAFLRNTQAIYSYLKNDFTMLIRRG